MQAELLAGTSYSLCQTLQHIWRILGLQDIPPQLIGLIMTLYTGAVSAVWIGGSVSDFFLVRSGIHQGYVLVPTLFNAGIDWILGRMVAWSTCNVLIAENRITDLSFVLVESLDVLRNALLSLSEEVEPLGLRVYWVKTKFLSFIGYSWN
ncbi:uncharacterized protein LOC106872375 [Octopus bimaculoides]|uniref:uncharacterized protein LOC106872375 n=1 Tax=Octopus bimaculoides TaxID=37653 RepID=UPI00071DF935|nr:uncharacterized protein LOC106872375 [Octopus bimaculoides]|eukprot:XP_014774833.1 PREDICTED: uncharacterized protein LOC106872375 [Octopus bimaculoides]